VPVIFRRSCPWRGGGGGGMGRASMILSIFTLISLFLLAHHNSLHKLLQIESSVLIDKKKTTEWSTTIDQTVCEEVKIVRKIDNYYVNCGNPARFFVCNTMQGNASLCLNRGFISNIGKPCSTSNPLSVNQTPDQLLLTTAPPASAATTAIPFSVAAPPFAIATPTVA
jgi:hypothetical protein